MKKFALGLSLVALAAAGTAYAQPGGRVSADADGDGVITRDEARTRAASMFARMDADRDGKLTQADREARREQMRGKMFAAMDADNNGSISRDEFMSFDHKGMKGKQHHMGKRGHAGRMGARMADTNNDGAVSQAEFVAAADKRFEAMDANNDGQVTQEERRAHRQEMRGKWREMKQQRDAS